MGAAGAATTQVVDTPAPTAVLPATEPTALPATEPAARRPSRSWVWIALPALTALVGLGILVAALMGAFSKTSTTEPSSPPPTTRPPTAAATITVPEVVGLRVDDAVARLRAAGIGAANIDVALAEEGDPGIVVDVQPNQGATVSKEKTVTLFIGPPGGGDGGGKKDGHGKDKKD